MLTGNLLRVSVGKSDIKPKLVKVTSPMHTKRAGQLLGLFDKAVALSQSRKDIEDWINELSALDTNHKIFKGFAKILLDRSEFEEPSLDVEPSPKASEVRAEVFLLAAQKGPFAKIPIDQTRYSNTEIFISLPRRTDVKKSYLRSLL